MTYKTLIERLSKLTAEQLDNDVTILIDEDDYHPIQRLWIADESQNVLDNKHPVLVV